jgi:hypothetical protein
MAQQGQFDFDSIGDDSGHSRWLVGRQMAAADLARKIGLPLGHMAEVWLRGNIRLSGRLRLRDEVLFIEESALNHLELTVDNVPFTVAEMESCVRLD